MPAEQAPAKHDPIVSDEELCARASERIKTGFLLFTIGMLLVIAGLLSLLVTQIVDSLTPSLRRDLAWKALRGATSLSHEVEQGLRAHSAEEVALAARDYVADPDVRAIVVLSPAGVVVHRHGDSRWLRAGLFEGAPGTLHERDHELVVWAESRFEDVPVGRVALVVSSERVAAGENLRARSFAAVAVGCLIAFAAALLFMRLYVEPILRITRVAVAKLEQKTALALEATRAKSEFLANMSHEIRTPMNGVIGMVDRLLRTELEARQLRFAELIQTSAQGLLTILDDVLDFSKIEAGKYELHASSFDARLIVRDLVELLAPRAHERGVEVAYDIAPEVPQRVSADVDRFRQILTNLLGNALKFTTCGEVVLLLTVREQTPDHVLLHCAIRDTGPGISEEGLSRLFASFTQVDGSSSRQPGGTGLGLAISRRLAALMGGEVGVQSELGRGSTFWFTVCAQLVAAAPRSESPLGKRALVVDGETGCRAVLEGQLTRWGVSCVSRASVCDAMLAIEQTFVDAQPFELVLIESQLESGAGIELAAAIAKGAVRLPVALLVVPGAASSMHTPEGVALLAKPLREADLHAFVTGGGVAESARTSPSEHARRAVQAIRGRVLAVDDNEINRTVAVELLIELGYAVDVALNGQDALEKVEHGQYDAVLMDCQMPVCDGYEATRAIRRWEQEQGRAPLLIIALTAHAFHTERAKVLAAGMDEYLTKPVVSATLERALGSQLAARSAQAGSPHEARARDGDASAVWAMSSHDDVGAAGALLDASVRRSRKVLELFLELTPEQLRGLTKAVAHADLAELAARAHKLKGGCASIGATPLAAACEHLRHAAMQADLGAAVQALAALERSFSLTSQAVRAELARVSAVRAP